MVTCTSGLNILDLLESTAIRNTIARNFKEATSNSGASRHWEDFCGDPECISTHLDRTPVNSKQAMNMLIEKGLQGFLSSAQQVS